jgi:GcrA cell cycle regulator
VVVATSTAAVAPRAEVPSASAVAPVRAAPVRPQAPREPRGDIIGVLELGPHMCKWPIGDPGDADFGFCGAQAVAGLPYCAEHAAVAYQPHVARRPGERKEDRAAAEVRRLSRLANY